MSQNMEIISGFEKARRVSSKGAEYWHARELMLLLGYSDWRNFCNAMERGIASCDAQKVKATHHFVETTKMVGIGSGAERESDDYKKH
ncbi:MAG: hypothetical protein V1929_12435 [bacterium]